MSDSEANNFSALKKPVIELAIQQTFFWLIKLEMVIDERFFQSNDLFIVNSMTDVNELAIFFLFFFNE